MLSTLPNIFRKPRLVFTQMLSLFICLGFYQSNELSSQELIRFYSNSKAGYKSAEGQIVVAPIYDAGSEVYEGAILVMKDRKWGFLDSKGNVLIPLEYDAAGVFKEGLAKVALQGNYGFISKTGETVVPLKYENADDFSEGSAIIFWV